VCTHFDQDSAGNIGAGDQLESDFDMRAIFKKSEVHCIEARSNETVEMALYVEPTRLPTDIGHSTEEALGLA
jgi:hypothetical protein